MAGLYSHTTRATGTTLTASIYNTDHQNHVDNQTPQMTDDYSSNVAQMQSTVNPGGVGTESLATTLAGEVERLRYVIKTMHGGAQWYPGAAFVSGTSFDAKGDLLAGTAADAFAALTVGENNAALLAASDETSGLRWGVITPRNYVINGTFAVNQIVTPTTTDNSYPIDGWKLLLGAVNAATFEQDTADVPTGAGYAAKLIVGSGNNNKFGLFCPIENKDMLSLRGSTCALRVALKATAGLVDGTGKIRIGILEFTGSADAISADPISAWGAEGTNPTLAANWAFANTPAAIAVTTAWVNYSVTAVTISASATNVAVLIWSDDTTNTQTTDILRIGGFVTLSRGSAHPVAHMAPFEEELRRCQRYFYKTFPQATAPAQNAGLDGALYIARTANNAVIAASYCVTMRAAPTITYFNPSNTNALARNISTPGDAASTASLGTPNDASVSIAIGGGSSGDNFAIHFTADARL